MTRKSTWTNADGLVVGFGPNFPERQEAGVVKTEGNLKEARINVTYQSTFGESGAVIQLPKNAVFHTAWLEVGTAWTSSDSGTLAVGHDEADTADVDAILTAQAPAALLAGARIVADGVIAVGDNADNRGNPTVITDSYDDSTIGAKVFFTKANNFTAGTATLVVQYA
jgi:hypothetical protein